MNALVRKGGRWVAPPTWVRPREWLPLPVIGSGVQKFAGLFAVTNDSGNYLALKASGDYTVDWGDGSPTEDIAAGVTAEHQYDYADLANTVTRFGVTYRQAIVTVVPQAEHNLTDLNLQQGHSFFSGDITNTPWLDVLISSSALETFTLSSAALLTKFGMLEQFRMQENAVVAMGASNFAAVDASYNALLPVLYNIVFGDMPALTTATDGGNSFVYNLYTAPDVTMGDCPLLLDATDMVTCGSGSLGNVTLGNFALVTTADNMVGCPGYNVGNVTIGNLPALTALAGNLVYADAGSIGDVLLGDLPLLASDTVQFIRAATGIGDVTIGSLASFNSAILLIDAGNGSVGNVAFGDLSAWTGGARLVAAIAVASITIPALPALTNMNDVFSFSENLRQLLCADVSAVTSATGALAGTALQHLTLTGIHLVDVDVSNLFMSAAALAALFTSLGTASGKTITVTGNYGAVSLTPAQLLIATAKGWTVVQ